MLVSFSWYVYLTCRTFVTQESNNEIKEKKPATMYRSTFNGRYYCVGDGHDVYLKCSLFLFM